MDQTAVILVNVGTPDSPAVSDVRKYLSQFLNDRRVIDLPWLLQKMLVNLIIVPFRAPKSAKLYKELWTENGSPLLHYSESAASKLQMRIGEGYHVFNAMRYGSPGLDNALEVIKYQNYKKIILLPLFPQYASATTGSVFQFVLSRISSWNTFPELHFIDHFHDHPGFVAAFAANALKYQSVSQWDHVIFSFHGLPLKQINKVHPEKSCSDCRCKTETIEEGRFCYQASCYETARLISARMGLIEGDYSITFQSRLTKNWMSPFTDEVLVQKAKAGIKKILILAPSFVADCLETKLEIGKEYQHLFQEHGGEVLQLVEGLNDNDFWVEGLKEIIENHN
jgi:ferrochelatase